MKTPREYEGNTKGIRRQRPSIALASRVQRACIALPARLQGAGDGMDTGSERGNFGAASADTAVTS